MARSKNSVLKGASGRIGEFVVKEFKDGRQVLANLPRERKKHSPEQKKHLDHFQEAKDYAKHVKKRSALREQYERGAKGTTLNWQNLAIRDFMNPPEISEIGVDFYAGEPGEVIRIRATDDFKVVSVSVKITGANRKVIEKGEAQARGKRGLWRFFTTTKNPQPKGTEIKVTAVDFAGNDVTAVLACSDIVGEQIWRAPKKTEEEKKKKTKKKKSG